MDSQADPVELHRILWQHLLVAEQLVARGLAVDTLAGFLDPGQLVEQLGERLLALLELLATVGQYDTVRRRSTSYLSGRRVVSVDVLFVEAAGKGTAGAAVAPEARKRNTVAP